MSARGKIGTFVTRDARGRGVTVNSDTSNTPLPSVREIFPSEFISTRSGINWFPQSPDLTPMVFFVWGYLECKLYNNKPTFLVLLKENIRYEIAAITESTFQVDIGNFTVR